MELKIDSYTEISQFNYEKIRDVLQDPSVPCDFKYQLISLLKDHSSIANSPPISEIISSKLFLLLIDLKNQMPLDEKSTLNIIWIITNMATGSKSDTDYVIENKGVEFMLCYISNDNKEIVRQTVWGLANIAGESPIHRDLILNYNVLVPIMNYFKQEMDLPIIKTVIWFICGVCRGHPIVDYQLIKPVVNYLKHFLQFCGNYNILMDFLWAISSISEINSEALDDLVSNELINNLVQNFFTTIENDNKLLTPFLRILANMVAGDEVFTSFVINLGIIDKIFQFFNKNSANIRKETAFLFSNIAAGTHLQIQSILNINGFFEKIKKIFILDELKVKKECVWILTNLLTSNFPLADLKIKEAEIMTQFVKIFMEFNSVLDLQKNMVQAYITYWKFLKKSNDFEALKKFRKELKDEFLNVKEEKIEELTEIGDLLEIIDEEILELETNDHNLNGKINDLKIED